MEIGGDAGVPMGAASKARRAWRDVPVAMLVAALVPLGLAVVAPPTGDSDSHWLAFLGGFHPAIVHFPIALVIIIPLLEYVGRRGRRAHLRLSTHFLWAVAFASALVTPLLGWCLASSGATGPLVTQHMWAGVLLPLACVACWALAPRPESPVRALGVPYVGAMAVAVALVVFAGYRGGQITHGANHLTASLPTPLDRWFGAGGEASHAGTSPPDGYYAVQIAPILEQYCVSCHGPNKQKGRLRLDSYVAVLRGGKSGAVVAPNDSASELLRRITLPPSHDEFMPSGKAPLPAHTIAALEAWIAAGAPETGVPGSFAAVAAVDPGEAAAHIIEEADPAEVARERAPLLQIVADLQKEQPGLVEYESRSSANLILHASTLGMRFGDAELHELRPLFERLVTVDLSRTGVSDASAERFGAMPRLRELRLAQTAVTDEAIMRLASVQSLEVLTLYGTQVSSRGLAALTELPKLRAVFAAETPAAREQSQLSPAIARLVVL